MVEARLVCWSSDEQQQYRYSRFRRYRRIVVIAWKNRIYLVIIHYSIDDSDRISTILFNFGWKMADTVNTMTLVSKVASIKIRFHADTDSAHDLWWRWAVVIIIVDLPVGVRTQCTYRSGASIG